MTKQYDSTGNELNTENRTLESKLKIAVDALEECKRYSEKWTHKEPKFFNSIQDIASEAIKKIKGTDEENKET